MQGYDWTKQTIDRYWPTIDSFECIEFFPDSTTSICKSALCVQARDQTYVASGSVGSVKFIEFEMFDLISRGSPSPCEF